MLSLSALVVSLAVTGAGETVLIDFSAPWCGPCRQMEPVLARLAAAGYPVRQVNIDAEPELKSRFRIGPIPCFVLVAGGREVDRVVGATSFENLEGLLKKHGVPTGSQANQSRGQSPDVAPRAQPANPAQRAPVRPASVTPGTRPGNPTLDESLGPRLLASSVRLKINDPQGHSFGSGTIIDAQDGNALVLTCGHLFRDSQGKGQIFIDTFGPHAERGLPGRLVGYDLQSDVGLVSFSTRESVAVVRVAPTSYRVRSGEAVINIGCNNGQDPTVRTSRVTTIDKFLGPPNLQVAGQPVVGRSGGGLFNAEGLVIGVCNAADPADNEGLYAALPSIRAELDRRGLSDLHGNGRSIPAGNVASSRERVNSLDGAPPAMPRSMPAVATSEPMSIEPGRTRAAVATAATTPTAGSSPVQLSQLDRLSGEERAVLGALASGSAAEVVCIVRPRSNPAGKSEVVVLEHASPGFLQQLAAEQRAQQTQQTSLEVGRGQQRAADSRQLAVARPQIAAAGGPRRPAWQPHWLLPR